MQTRTLGRIVVRLAKAIGVGRQGAGTPVPCELEGDRAIEWSWVVAHLPQRPSRVLDVGCVQSALTAIAARLGHSVTAVDLRDIEYDMAGVTFRKGDICGLGVDGPPYDVVMNCSTIEHVGLAGRYGSGEQSDGDLVAMASLRGWLELDGRMLLTIPVGRDTVFSPLHRIYGAVRLPQLLRGYVAVEEEYWAKDGSNLWRRCAKAAALGTQGSEGYYALGLFVLSRT